jgi:hypothetical protein
MKTLLTLMVALLFSLTAYSQKACEDCFGNDNATYESQTNGTVVEKQTSSPEIQRLNDYSKEQKSRKRKPFKDTFVGGEIRQIGYIAVLVVCSILTAVMLNGTHSALIQ